MEKSLVKVIESSSLEPVEAQSLLERFGNYEDVAKEWKTKAEAIVVTDESQTTEMAMAKEARKKFSQMRIDVEKARKSLKEQSLRKGQAIDAVAKFIVSLIEPIEKHLKSQEDFIKIQENKRLEAKRLEEEKKAEQERLAQLEAERKEQERIKKENEVLKREQEKQAKVLAEEREKLRKAEAEKVEAVEKQKVLEFEKKVVEKKLGEVVTCPHCKETFRLEK